METKICKACERQLPVSDFSAHPTAADRLQYNCRPCMSDINRVNWQKRRAKKEAERAAAGLPPLPKRGPAPGWKEAAVEAAAIERAELQAFSMLACSLRPNLQRFGLRWICT